MKKYKFSIILFGLGSIFAAPLVAISCVDAGQIRNQQQYIKSFNEPNFLTTNDYSFNSNKYLNNDTDSLVFSPIIGFEYRDKVVLDHVNNNVLIPTKKIRRLNLVNFITIRLRDGKTKVYNNDNFDLSLTPPDSANGFKNPILKVLSNDDLSINNKSFETDLSNASSVQINLKKANYVNHKGELTSHVLSAEDFLLSLSKKVNKEKYEEIKKVYSVDLGVNSNNELVINNSGTILLNFIEEELEKNMMFNPTSKTYLESLSLTIDEYKPKLEEAQFLSFYVLNSNDIEKQKYIKNIHSANNRFVIDSNTLNEIILNFNSVPIDIETYRLQTFKAYRQNLISESDFSTFNSTQQRDIMNFSSAYGLTLQLPSSNLTSNINSVYNSDFDLNKKFDFNDAFSKLIYGETKSTLNNELIKKFMVQNKNSYLFRLYLSNIINLRTLSDSLGFNSYWNNIAPPQIKLTGTDEKFTNYKILSDAKIWVTQGSIPDYNFSSFDKTNNILESNISFSKKTILDYNLRLRSKNYDFIKTNIKLILDDFYSKNENLKNQKIKFTIPVFSIKNDVKNKNVNEIKNLINNLDDRISADVIIVDDFYNKNINSFIKKINITYLNFSMNSYSNIIFENRDVLHSILFNQNPDLNLIEKLKSILLNNQNPNTFIAMLKNDLSLLETSKERFLNFMMNLTNFEQITFINQVGISFPIPISLNLFSSDDSFTRILVQNNLIKPTNDLGFNQFQDIKAF